MKYNTAIVFHLNKFKEEFIKMEKYIIRDFSGACKA
jgi:hypothetical protein